MHGAEATARVIARALAALETVADCAPQLARLTRAAERQADALSLLALDRYLDHMGPSAADTRTEAARLAAARNIAARALVTLGRRLTTQAATSDTDTQEHAENDPTGGPST